jgi:1,4-alpha-glucan branching enzyme
MIVNNAVDYKRKTPMIRRQPIPNRHQVEITFVLPADFPYVPISVVGDFNQWEPNAHPLTRGNDGTYQVTVPLEAGRRYAFRYLSQGGRWFNEGFADDLEPGPFGRYNSILAT